MSEADLSPLALLRGGLNTIEIAEYLGLPSEAAAYNLINCGREEELAQAERKRKRRAYQREYYRRVRDELSAVRAKA